MSYLRAFLTVAALVFFILSISILILWVDSGGFEPYYTLIFGLFGATLFLRNRISADENQEANNDGASDSLPSSRDSFSFGSVQGPVNIFSGDQKEHKESSKEKTSTSEPSTVISIEQRLRNRLKSHESHTRIDALKNAGALDFLSVEELGGFLLGDPYGGVREAAAEILGEKKDKSAIQYLKVALQKGPSPSVKNSGCKSFGSNWRPNYNRNLA